MKKYIPPVVGAVIGASAALFLSGGDVSSIEMRGTILIAMLAGAIFATIIDGISGWA